jgi:hypothetical protein
LLSIILKLRILVLLPVFSAGRAIDDLKDAMGNQVPDEEESVPLQATRNRPGSSALWEAFDKEVSHRSAQPTARIQDSISSEVVKYLKMVNIPRSAQPLQWWYTVGKEMFPVIYEIAKKHLVVPGSSVPSERVFSTAGNVITKKRSLLADDTASNLIFLRENLSKKKK